MTELDDAALRSRRSRAFRISWILTYIITLVNCSLYLREVADIGTGGLKGAFLGAVLASYAFIYILPVFLPLALWNWLIDRNSVEALLASIRLSKDWAFALPLALGVSAVQVLIYADRILYHLYGFHFNGFVLNLVFTRGGLESMGGSKSTEVTLAMLCLGVLVVHLVAFWWIIKSEKTHALLATWISHRRIVIGVLLIFLLGAFERGTYMVSSIRGYTPVLASANAFPFYLPTTWRNLGDLLGISVSKSERFKFKPQKVRVMYPLEPIRLREERPRYNIVWLVSESLRADMLDPEIMPHTSVFGKRAAVFQEHYSAGNGTRMGMFGMFYGLYAPYWFPFLEERQGPVLVRLLLDDEYQMELFTSARFSYPEFDSTVFADVPPEHLHEAEGEYGWQKDRTNVAEIIKFLDGRDPDRPFFTFLFFESPHARYYFPPEDAIRKPYLEDFNYVTMNLELDIELIKNRYINSCHHLDSQIQRLLERLESENLLDSTIVLITGDHGEEFLEHGRWGHNSAFSPEQIRVPMVLSIPGRKPGIIERMTSHLDIPATLLKVLGVENDPIDYTSGQDLFSGPERQSTILGDWGAVVHVDREITAVFPLQGMRLPTITDNDLNPLPDSNIWMQESSDQLASLLRELKRFSK